MAERDPSELDLAAAFRAYLEDAPTQVRPTELARQLAVAHPRGRTAPARWGFGRTPALAWVLLLLAALLAAMVGGLLVAGSQTHPTVPAVMPPVVPAFVCPPGSTPDKPGPVGQARPLGPPTMAFDRRAGRMVAFAQTDSGLQTWTFDVCTNTWTRMHPNQEPPDPGLDGGLVYDVDSDVTIGIFQRNAWAYELGADTWTRKSEVPSVKSEIPAVRDFSPELLYDPISGLVVAVDRAGGLWSYDVETDTWTPIRQETGPYIVWGISAFTYDASVDRLIAYAPFLSREDETWLFDIRTGRWSRSRAATPYFTLPAIMATLNPAIAYDEAAKRTVISGDHGMAAYDATTDRWETLFDVRHSDQGTTIPGRPERFPRWMAYDPLNGRLVAPGEIPAAADGDFVGTAPDGAAIRVYDLLAFDPLTREWTVLLEPGQ